MKEGLDLQDLERTATLIVWNGSCFVYHDADFASCDLELDPAPPGEVRDRILHCVGREAKEASRVETPFERIAPESGLWWQGSTADGLQAPMGRAGARKIQCLDLGKGVAQHALVVGRTGSGKSALLHAVITSLALTYAPEELEFYLIDFKKGVEFKTYAIHSLPHARVIAIESEREFGLSVLQGLNAEVNRRGDLFRGIGVDHIRDYRMRAEKALPRILLIVDEFQEFFVEDDTTSSQASQILDRLVRQGRAFGVHVLLGSQTLTGAYTPSRSTIGQIGVRIALQCDEPDSRLILAEDNPAARLLSRPGEAIYNAANGLVEGNNLFQVAWLPEDKHNAYLKSVTTMAHERRYVAPQTPIIFEGNAPAEVQKNRLLSDLLGLTDWPARARKAAAWLGDPVAIKEPTAAHFQRQSGRNLLIVGQNEEAAAAMVMVSLVSLAAHYRPQETEFYVLDFGAADAAYAARLTALCDCLPHSVQVVERRKPAEVIAKLFTEVKKRLGSEGVDGKEDVFLVVFGLQRARDLRQEDDFSYGTLDEKHKARSPAEQFDFVLTEGPAVGVFTIAWCDTYKNLTRTLDRRTLREFEMRVIFQTSAEDSNSLIDSPLASRLGPYRAFYACDEEQRMEKFRPYSVPTTQWLGWVRSQLQRGESVDSRNSLSS